jgi:hypothetical protein
MLASDMETTGPDPGSGVAQQREDKPAVCYTSMNRIYPLAEDDAK